jgi:alpha-glucosidase (family GH31 glycosyl hydrolase)
MNNSLLELPHTFSLLENECWWGGRTADGVHMPFTAASRHRVELHSDLHSNQGAPFLLSSRGRYLWSDRPFTYEFFDGQLRLTGSVHPVLLSDGHGSLAGAFRAASHRHFAPSGATPPEEFFAEPQYNTWIELNHHQTQARVLEYARGILDHGFPAGVLMIDAGWFEYFGHLDFHPGRFPNPRAMMRQLKEWGFRVMLWVAPYFSADSREYRRWRELPGWLLRTRGKTPAVLEWWDGYSVHLDLTHPEALAWFHGELARLQRDYGIDGFKFDAGDTAHFVHRPSSWLDAAPADLCEAWARIGLHYPFNEMRACWKMGGTALVQRLHDRSPLWDATGLGSLIPNGLALGLLGHPFLCPDMIGGGDYMYFHRPDFTVDEELFVRWAQTSALFPMMQFSCAPWRVLSKAGLDLCRATVELRSRFRATMAEVAVASAKSGEPMMRSLEYQFPGHGYAAIKDQFLIGDALLVAPVLSPGARTRRVHIPPGRWRDDRGDIVVGPREIEMETPLERLPYLSRLS